MILLNLFRCLFDNKIYSGYQIELTVLKYWPFMKEIHVSPIYSPYKVPVMCDVSLLSPWTVSWQTVQLPLLWHAKMPVWCGCNIHVCFTGIAMGPYNVTPCQRRNYTIHRYKVTPSHWMGANRESALQATVGKTQWNTTTRVPFPCFMGRLQAHYTFVTLFVIMWTEHVYYDYNL